MDPLARLAADFARDGAPSLAWAVEHAGDGDVPAAVRRAWENALEPAALVALLVATRDARALLAAACACAEDVLPLIPTAPVDDLPEPPQGADCAARGLALACACARGEDVDEHELQGMTDDVIDAGTVARSDIEAAFDDGVALAEAVAARWPDGGHGDREVRLAAVDAAYRAAASAMCAAVEPTEAPEQARSAAGEAVAARAFMAFHAGVPWRAACARAEEHVARALRARVACPQVPAIRR